MHKDIKLLNEIISLREPNEVLKRKFFWLYPFTNENIKGYYSDIDFNDKDVLCVTSSGDHALNAILNGAKSVSSFDINPLAKYYLELKIAAIKTLTLEEFIMFFYNKKITTYKYCLNKKIYEKFNNNLCNEYREFWDYFFDNYTKKDIFKSYLFSDDYLNLNALVQVNSYLKDENYYKLKDLLSNKSIRYYDLDLEKLSSINRKFDILVFSNIFAFLDFKNNKELLSKIKESIDLLSKKGYNYNVNSVGQNADVQRCTAYI